MKQEMRLNPQLKFPCCLRQTQLKGIVIAFALSLCVDGARPIAYESADDFEFLE